MKKKDAPVDKLAETSVDELKLIALIHSGFAGLAAAAIVEISTRENYNTLLLIAVASFAIAIPISLLVVILINYRLMIRSKLGSSKKVQFWPKSWVVQGLRYISYSTGFIGFLALFWNIHAYIGSAFLITSMVAIAVGLAAEYFKSKMLEKEPAGDMERAVMDKSITSEPDS